MAPYEALYGRRCRSPVCWFEVGETTLIGPDSVLYAMEKVQLIRDRLKKTQSRQKSYAASVVPLESVTVKDSLSYEDVAVEILDRQDKRMRNKEIASAKILWRSQSVEGATWEAEYAIKDKYRYLFSSDSTSA
ncbi:uncharacterized protein [Solanum lycopersicum]|uniref:uncharacterized protein n=1 Tax=Solanum lycopersicum TaxID=4081 RepID=UPI0037498461